jgi:NAD-dependent dihydropyrimidine dehydrogenase PreA subunit
MDRSQPGPVIDEERCTACGCCVEACPSGVFEHDESHVSAAQPQNCGGCGECELACPEDAVEVPFGIVWGDQCAPDPDAE